MNRNRIISIVIAFVFSISSICMISESSFAANPIPNYCTSYKAIGKKMDKYLLAHKKTFKITVRKKHADFLDCYVLNTHRKVDPHSIIRAGDNLNITGTLEIVSIDNASYYVFTLKPKYKHSAKRDKKLYRKVRSVAKKARKIKSKKKRVKYINNYLIKHTKYAVKYPTAYDVLVRGKGNCNAYSEAFTLIACHAGLSAETVAGKFKKGKVRGAHAWNVVKLGKKWRCLDVTLNDQKQKRARNKYLLIKYKKFKKTHKLHPYYKKIGWTKKHPMK